MGGEASQNSGSTLFNPAITLRPVDLGPPISELNLQSDQNQSGSLEDRTAVLLIAHGSRRAAANQDLLQLADLISSRHQYHFVGVSYLELAPPTIIDGGRLCVERGATRVLMLPYFLSAGVHVVNDLEENRTQLATEFPDVKFVLCPHLGLHPLMVDIVMSRLREGNDRQVS